MSTVLISNSSIGSDLNHTLYIYIFYWIGSLTDRITLNPYPLHLLSDFSYRIKFRIGFFFDESISAKKARIGSELRSIDRPNYISMESFQLDLVEAKKIRKTPEKTRISWQLVSLSVWR